MVTCRAYACPHPGRKENQEVAIRDQTTEFAMAKPLFK
jgi:hypothetical protein